MKPEGVPDSEWCGLCDDFEEQCDCPKEGDDPDYDEMSHHDRGSCDGPGMCCECDTPPDEDEGEEPVGEPWMPGRWVRP